MPTKIFVALRMNIERPTIDSLVYVNDWWQWIVLILDRLLVVCEFPDRLINAKAYRFPLVMDLCPPVIVGKW